MTRSFQIPHRQPLRAEERGSAVLIVLILLSLMVTLIAGNLVSLNRLKTELRLLDQKQQRRLEQLPLPQTRTDPSRTSSP